MTDDQLTFEEFREPTFEEWREVAIASLKGAPFDKLTTRTPEAITLQPLYTAEQTADIAAQYTVPGEFPFVRGTSATPAAWQVAQEIAYRDPAQFNAALRHDLERGQTAINITRFKPMIGAIDDMRAALDGIDLAAWPFVAQTGLAEGAMLFALADNPADLRGFIGFDPLGSLVRLGIVRQTAAYDAAAALTRYALDHAPNVRTIMIDVRRYHDAGASAVEEIAYALATGAEYIRELTGRGLSVDEVCGKMTFALGIGADFFMQIAKFRAARSLWAHVVRAFGGDDESAKMHVYAATGNTNKARLDAYNNMLRTTTEALSAAIAGVDAMHVAPFDETLRVPDEFSRRIARNQQIILQEEVNLSRVIDPAGGSYAVEHLTDAIGRSAWEAFQHIEAEGGIVAALTDGRIQAALKAQAAERSARYATRRERLVGVNMYVNLDEDDGRGKPEFIAARPATATPGTSLDDIDLTRYQTIIDAVRGGAKSLEINEMIEGLHTPDVTITTPTPVRFAAPFEELRGAIRRHAELTGAMPQVFLANLGALRRHKARADFAAGFLAAGGFRTIYPAGFDSPQDAAQAALDSGAAAVVICGTDDDYPSSVPPFVEALRAGGADMPVILAGYPQAQIDALKAAGVDAFIYLGADCLAFNRELHQRLGIE